MQIRIGLPLRSAWFEWPWGCSRDLEAMQMSRWCANSMRHQPSACAMLRRSAACVRPSVAFFPDLRSSVRVSLGGATYELPTYLGHCLGGPQNSLPTYFHPHTPSRIPDGRTYLPTYLLCYLCSRSATQASSSCGAAKAATA